MDEQQLAEIEEVAPDPDQGVAWSIGDERMTDGVIVRRLVAEVRRLHAVLEAARDYAAQGHHDDCRMQPHRARDICTCGYDPLMAALAEKG